MSKKIRVLYTIPNFNTAGSGKSVYDLVRKLDKNIFEPEICCFHDKGDFFKEVEQLNVKIHLFPFTTDYRPRITFIFRVLKIAIFFKSNNFDVIHSWHWSSDISEPLAAKLAGIPYIYTKKAMGWANKFWIWRSRLSSKIIAVNNDMVKLYFSKMKHKVLLFPLAIDVEHYKPINLNSNLRSKYNITEGDFVIVTVVNLVPVKGLELLIEAVRIIDDNNIKVFVVGNDKNEYGQELKERYKSDKNLFFVGKQLEVRPYLEFANLFVIPTKDEGRREGIPNAPLEAMASECLVIGSNISGIKDILREFPECLFEASNVNQLARKIIDIKNMPKSDKAELGKAMRNQVVKEFSIEEFLSNHEELYLSIVKKNK